MIIEISDATTPMLSAIAQVSKFAAFEQMGKIGAKAKKNTTARMKSLRNRHHWFQKPNTSKNKKTDRVPYYDLTSAKRLGDRTELDGSLSDPSSMANFITSNLMESSGTLVVGGRNREKWAYRYNDGVQGAQDQYVPAVTDHSQAILIKLDQGKLNQYYGWGKGGSEKQSMHGFRNARYRATNFMSEGFRDTIPYMQDKLTNEYGRVVGRAINRVNVKVTTRKIG